MATLVCADWLAAYFASHCIPGTFPFYILQFRTAANVWSNTACLPTVCMWPFVGDKYQGQVYLLADSLSSSASCTFLNIMKAHLPDRAKLIGRPCDACIGGKATVGRLPNSGLDVVVSTCKAFGLQGKILLEGNPPAVDFPVEWTRADILENRDPDLEKALELIGPER